MVVHHSVPKTLGFIVVVLLCSPLAAYSQTFAQGKSLVQANKPAEALTVFKSLAENGDAEAQNEVGAFFERGLGTEKDLVKAFDWYQKSAAQGFTRAFFNLAVLYANGEPAGQDLPKAAELFRRSAERGHAPSQRYLGQMYDEGLGVPVDAAQAAQWYLKAASQGDAHAQNNLGVLHMSGRGVSEDHGRAVYWQAKAARQGNSEAPTNITRNLSVLTPYEARWARVAVRETAAVDGTALVTLKRGARLYGISDPGDFWIEVYAPDGHHTGFVPKNSVDRAASSSPVQTSKKPSEPLTERPGYTTCNTKCINAACTRTYADGREVRFQAKQVWDPFESTFKFDPGPC